MNGKRDMRKKFVKSSRPTYKKRIKKAQQGMRFVNYNVVENPTIDYKDITNPTNPFSEYNFNTTYNTPQGLVVPTREDSKPDTVEETPVIANNPTVEPVVNKPVTKTAKSTWKSPYTNRKQWTTELINAYKKAGITNDNAIRMLLAQDALESSWGKSAQGKYNFGNLTTGSSWKGDYVTGNDKNAKGEAIKQKFRSYNSMDEYAADKIQFLKRLYDFDENDDINKFVAKLTGSNKGKRRYAEASNYAKVLTGIYNGIPKGENGMIIKYQNPAQPIARRDATYVAPKMYAPRPYKTKEEEIIEQNRNSEMISIPAHSTIGMIDGKLQVVDTPARQITNIGAGYLSGTDPVGEFVVGNVVAGKPLMWLGRGLEYGAAKAGSQWARNRVVGKAISNSEIKTPTQSLPNNVGWGPRQTIKGAIHDKGTMSMPKLYYPERWDAINEGAPKAGVWFQGRLGTPRDATNTSIANKVEKAANARDLFAKRPVRVEGDLELNKPLVTVGDVPNRAQIQKAADTMGGDGVIFNNVYDNGYGHNQVIFSYRTDLKNGKMFKKGTQPSTATSKKDAYYPTRVVKRTTDDINLDYLNFLEYIDNPETMQRLANIDKELGTQYVKAVNDFKDAARQGKLKVRSRRIGDLDIQGDVIRNPQTLTHPNIMKEPSYDYIDVDVLADFPPHSVMHEFKHAIENYQAALSGIKGSVDDALLANPRLQALMKDNIVSEDEFVATMKMRYPKKDVEGMHKVYKYLTNPGEFNSQLSPLIELEQRVGKSGLPNFKNADAVGQVIKQGRASGHDASYLDILFNHLLKPDRKEEFVKQFNKYGWGLAAPVIMSNGE